MKKLLKNILHWFIWKRRCAWCRRWMSGNPLGPKVSHGICPECKAKMEPNASDWKHTLGVRYEPPYED